MKGYFILAAIAVLLLSCNSKIKVIGEVVKGSQSSRDFTIEREKAKENADFLRDIGASRSEVDRDIDDAQARKRAADAEIVERLANVAVYDPKSFNEYLEANADKLDSIIKASTDKYGFDPATALQKLTSDIVPVTATATDSNGQFSMILPRRGRWVFITNSGVSWETVNDNEKVSIKDGSVFSEDSLKIILAQAKIFGR